jgi:dCTP deaminase
MPYKDPKIRREKSRYYAALYRTRSDVKEKMSEMGKKYRNTLHGFLVRLYNSIRRRSRGTTTRKSTIEYSITYDDLLTIWTRQGGKCAITNFPMSFSANELDYGRASLDRIDPTRGYHLGNIRFVCYWANIAKHRMTDDDLLEWCRRMLQSQVDRAIPYRYVGGIKPDSWIREQSIGHKMISPFVDKQMCDGVISYGLSSYGYDLRVADEFKIFTNVNNTVIDPKSFNERSFVNYKGPVCVIPPNSFALARTVEYLRIPRSVLTICLGKSTYARCGIIVNVTPLEPEWCGTVTIEISNTTPLPVKIYSNEGICQILFLEGTNICEVSYKDKKGKYQGQTRVTLPTVNSSAASAQK